MPVERISKAFKDISASFKVNPLTTDIIAIKNETAIARSIRNLVHTQKGEKFFRPNLGSDVTALLFENVDTLTASSIKTEIELLIKNYEPRVSLNFVSIIPNYDSGEFEAIINYNIIGIDVLPQQLSYALQPTR
jgi:phage baseplate assembly protein W|tara:strand:- start:3855 stop:4256 length:402 start_codon:yes stop_codon:yes gene_type:complete